MPAMATTTPGGRFETTHWSVVVAAGRDDRDSQSRRALETLCRTYWYPLYAYVRRKGHQPGDAADLVQGFFASLLERHAIAAADPHRGRFRAFLLSSLDHFFANQWRHDHAQKRGGGTTVLSLDFEAGERRFSREPWHDLTPDRVYERRWALTLIDTATARLRDEYANRGKAELFDALAPYVAGEGDGSYAEVAGPLGMSEGAIKVAVHRLRARLREILRQEVAQTVADAGDVDEELGHLFGAV